MRRRILGGLALAGVLAACGGPGDAGPPRILYGEDVCDHCRMVISEERHAAGALREGRGHRFDDAGCLRSFLASAAVGEGDAAWVHDEGRSWRRVEEAWFVVDPAGGTPMGSGILAFGSAEAAAAAGRRLGAARLRWHEIGEADPPPAE